MIDVRHGDCLDVLRTLHGLDACVTDPPYGLAFMGRQWDRDIAFQPETWRLVFDALKPGAHLLAFGGTRTSHRLTCAIEDAGFEIRDTVLWLYGSGFPKSRNVSKAIDAGAGVAGAIVANGNPVARMIPGADQNSTGSWIKDNGREYQPGTYVPATPEAAQWQGWGTTLKPAHEPIILARKPLVGTVAANVLAHGTGGLNIKACQVPFAGPDDERESKDKNRHADFDSGARSNIIYGADNAHRGRWGNYDPPGRWPANVCHDGSDEVLAAFAAYGARRSAGVAAKSTSVGTGNGVTYMPTKPQGKIYADTGTAARFYYCAKANAADRAGSKHPTIKPAALMRWLVRLITPPGGTVLDPFAGSGTTGEAAQLEGMNAVLIEREAEYIADIRRRMARWAGQDMPLFAEVAD